MKIRILFLSVLCASSVVAQLRTVHVMVALCDNLHQGIVPVPEKLGNGKDLQSNLYWGAAYGVRSYFRNKTNDWEYKGSIPHDHPYILERLLFKHKDSAVYLLADAYDGERIRECTSDFLKAANGQIPLQINHESLCLDFGGNANLLAYIGHNGLMDFGLEISFNNSQKTSKDVIILACYSQDYFEDEIKMSGAQPLLWTTHLMAPEAYTLKSALDGWILRETDEQIEERAAQTYHRYQKCGIDGARNLFTTGFPVY